ncbi:MAG: translation initiation factor IF-3 [Verrucomicrobia bacterium]|nr:translation initiation factor IF-3 [Verrucomicrobiota bacterium]
MEVRVLYQDLSVVLPTRKALAKAKELGLDLVEIAPNANPPVCRIVDYGKFKYDQSKQKKDRIKPATKLKEIKFRVRIEEHDYRIKMARAEGFLDHGDKLRIQLQFRGREMAHKELGFQLLNRVKDDLKTMAKADLDARLAGRQITMMLSPLPKNQRVRKFRVEIPDDYVDQDDLEDDDHEDDHAHEAHENHADPEAHDDDAAGDAPTGDAKGDA